jgi:hypothetical protein
MTLRKDYEYDFSDEFWAGDVRVQMTKACSNIHEEQNYNNGVNPIFDWTDELRKTNGRIEANENMFILKADKFYQIKNVPYERSTNN